MIIENDLLRVNTRPHGAELISIVSKQTGLEYMWQAGKEWSKHAPVLFPIVGQLKDNTFFYKEKPYQLPRHGFARDETFQLTKQDNSAIEYMLAGSKPRHNYPFAFNFYVGYEIVETKLRVHFKVSNLSDDPIYFSLGGHPAFNVPLNNYENYNDYYLQFEQTENANRYLLDNGLLSRATEPVLTNTDILPLSKELFHRDALVFKNLKSKKISLLSKKSGNGLHFYFNDFNSFGIWAAKDANFVCLEPWIGHADFTQHNQKLEEKEGIICLAARNDFKCYFEIEPI